MNFIIVRLYPNFQTWLTRHFIILPNSASPLSVHYVLATLAFLLLPHQALLPSQMFILLLFLVVFAVPFQNFVLLSSFKSCKGHIFTKVFSDQAGQKRILKIQRTINQLNNYSKLNHYTVILFSLQCSYLSQSLIYLCVCCLSPQLHLNSCSFFE